MKELIATGILLALAAVCVLKPDFLARQHIAFVADLPDSGSSVIEGREYDLGWKHSQGRIFRIPISGTTDGEYVLYREVGSKWHVYDLDNRKLRQISRSANIELSETPPISNHHNYWGWYILALFPVWGLTKKFIFST